MDEAGLEAALEAHGAQLRQVERALRAGPDPAELADLQRLRDDLRELLALTEASLVAVRKSKLLAALDAPGGPGTAASPRAEPRAEDAGPRAGAPAASPGSPRPRSPPASPGSPRPLAASASPGSPPASPGPPRPRERELSGRKVSAPWRGARGALEYHNAMVVGAAARADGGAGVRVLFLCPTHAALKPCPFFLEGRCRFQDSCRFSHGQVVAEDELRPFQHPDLSSLRPGSACLAKQQDGLWHPARVTDVDGGFYTVRFDSLLLKEAVVEGDGILPPLRREPATPEDSDGGGSDSDSDAADASYARVVEPDADADASAVSGPGSSAFGGWEVHTRGIGSRLLAKMGYEPGKGLGRRADGRLEPVLAVVLPRGRSLDRCAAALRRRPAGGGPGGGGAGPPRPPRAGGPPRPAPRSVFDFLNEQLRGPAAPRPAEAGAARRPGGGDPYRADAGARRALSLRLFRTQRRLEQTQRDIRGAQEALARHAGRHSATAARLQERLAGAQRLLGELRAQEAGLQREQRAADTHKKMAEF